MTAKIDIIDTVKMCESLKNKSLELKFRSLSILFELITTETGINFIIS